MNAHACRFVDYRDTLVFVNHVERNVFCESLERRQFDCACDQDFLASTQLHGRLGHFSVDQNFFLLDKLLHAHTAYVWKLGDEPLVQAGAGGRRRNRKNLLWRHFCHSRDCSGRLVDALSRRITLSASAVRTPTGIRSGPSRRTPSSRNPADKAHAISSLPATPSTPHTTLSRCP